MNIQLAPCPMFKVYYDVEGEEQEWSLIAETQMFGSMEQIQKEFVRLENEEDVTNIFLYELYAKLDGVAGVIWFARYAYLLPSLAWGLTKHTEQRLYSKGEVQCAEQLSKE